MPLRGRRGDRLARRRGRWCQRTVIGEGANDHGRGRPCSPGPKGSKDRAKGVRPFRFRFPRQPTR